MDKKLYYSWDFLKIVLHMVSIFSQYDDEISTTLLVKEISTINISLESVKIILLSCHSVSCKLQMLLACYRLNSFQWLIYIKVRILGVVGLWGDCRDIPTKGSLSLHLSTVYFSHLSYVPDKLRKCIHISKPPTVIRSCCWWNKQIIILSFVKIFFLNFF